MGEIPHALPNLTTSETKTKFAAHSILLAIFAAWPAPEGPTITVFKVIKSKVGCIDSIIFLSPPSNIVMEPEFAATGPPLTGPSIK